MKSIKELEAETRAEHPDWNEEQIRVELIKQMSDKLSNIQVDQELVQYMQAAQAAHIENMYHVLIDMILGTEVDEEERSRIHENFSAISAFDKTARLYEAARQRFEKKLYIAQAKVT